MFGQLTLQFNWIDPIATGTRQMQRCRINLYELPRFHGDMIPGRACVCLFEPTLDPRLGVLSIMKRIIRNKPLTPEEVAKYKAVREQVAEELPELIARHHERSASLDQLHELLQHLKATREAKGLSLADLTELTGMDRSALSKLETGQRANPTVETLVRYAEAVGKRLVVSLTDA
jgi:DNA-binding XRE family transcriptional regulator